MNHDGHLYGDGFICQGEPKDAAGRRRGENVTSARRVITFCLQMFQWQFSHAGSTKVAWRVGV